jgi:hypothetical protein
MLTPTVDVVDSNSEMVVQMLEYYFDGLIA